MIGRLFHARETALLLVFLCVFAGFSVFVEGFANPFSLFDRVRYLVATGIIATAGIDLSVGSLVALCGIVLGLLYQELSWPIWLASVVGVLMGSACGAFNGVVGSFMRVPPLVVTLATMSLFRGIAMGLSKGNPIRNLPDGFNWLGLGDLFVLRAGETGAVPFPASLIPLLLTMAIGACLLRRTWIGRFTECIGENEVAARFAAIDVDWMKFGLYTACGTVCGLASIFHTALYTTAKADTALGMELEVIACVVVGGTRISGGQASIVGTLLGLLFIGILRYGLEMAGVPFQYIIICVGCLLIVAAVFNERIAIQRR